MLYHSPKFKIDEKALPNEINEYQKIQVSYTDDGLYSEKGGGDFSLYLQDSYFNLEVDIESKRIAGVSGECNIESCENKALEVPSLYYSVILLLETEEILQKGSAWRIVCDMNILYDAQKKILQIGKINNGSTFYRCLGNMYIQLSEKGFLQGMLIVGI